MGRYVKKPIVVEAIQYDGKNSADIFEFCGRPYDRYVRGPVGNNYLEIVTLEGVMKAQPGDYIIKGVNGEFYPCKPDVFIKTYEEIE